MSFSVFYYYFFAAIRFLISLWWIYVPCFLFVLFKDIWIKHKRDQFIQEMKWVLLEVVPPRDVIKTPKVMENIFASLHTILLPPDWYKSTIKGEVQFWFSLEIASLGGDLHFFIKCLAGHRDLVEANIYAQYPEAEIKQVDDYVLNVPQDLPNEDYNVWGTEVILDEPDAYPVLSYPYFGKDINLEEQRIDPMASLLEVMNKAGKEEQIWLQMVARPIPGSWKKGAGKYGWKIESEKLRDELTGRKEKKGSKGGLLNEIGNEAGAFLGVAVDVLVHLVTGEVSTAAAGGGKGDEKKEQETPFLWKSTKHEQLVLNSIEEKMSKPAFEVVIRWLYLGQKDAFSMSKVSGVFGAFKQFGSQHLNSFKANKATMTAIAYGYQGKKVKESYRKKRIFRDYKKRDLVQHSKNLPRLGLLLFERLPVFRWFFARSKAIVLNIEELASLYHFPSLVVKAPTTPKVEAKRESRQLACQ